MRIRGFVSIIISVLILIVLFMIFSSQEKDIEIKTVCYTRPSLAQICWDVEVAKDKAKGLMSREELAKNSGMLFEYDEERIVSIWMKNMKIPIDIIWLNKDKKVVHLVENAQPCVDKCEGFKPKAKAQYVLELNAGQIQENDVQLGHKFDL